MCGGGLRLLAEAVSASGRSLGDEGGPLVLATMIWVQCSMLAPGAIFSEGSIRGGPCGVAYLRAGVYRSVWW